MRDTEVAPEVTVAKHAARNNTARTFWPERVGCKVRARHAKRSVGIKRRSIGLIRLVVVCILITQNIERATGRDFENRRDREV